MTEAEWLACADPMLMLELQRVRASERKLRLFAVACCCPISHLLRDERCRKAVEVGELHADGLVTDDVLDEARENSSDASGAAYSEAAAAGWRANAWIANAAANAASGVCGHWQNWLSDIRTFETPVWAARAIAGPNVEHILSDVTRPKRFEEEQETQCQLLRDLFGPLPFRGVGLDGAVLGWNDSALLKLAQGIYDDRAFDRLPVLADILEEAGCDSTELIAHCREPWGHVRGCWAVDLLLSKK